MVNTVNNNPGVNRAFSEMLQNNPALKTEDGVQQVDRLYTNSRGEVKQSSNAISHAFRKLVGKPVGAEAVRHALTQQVGKKEAERLTKNLLAEGEATLGDIDELINGRGLPGDLEVEDFDDDAALQASKWQEFQAMARSVGAENVDPRALPKADPTHFADRAYQKLTPQILSNLINGAAQEAKEIATQEGSKIDFGKLGIAGDSTAGFKIEDAEAYLDNNVSLDNTVWDLVQKRSEDLPPHKQNQQGINEMVDQPGIMQPILYKALINDLLSQAEPKTNRRVS
ncbi:MAG: hypothetical protein VW831_09385 [Gammaproteobacteria bacterium]